MRHSSRLGILPKRLGESRLAGCSARLLLYLGVTGVILVRLLSSPGVEETKGSGMHHSIVSVFKPFRTDHDARSQLTALSSWLGVQPAPTLYIILDHEQSILRIQSSFKSERIHFIRQIQRGFHGIPLFHAILEVASSVGQGGIVTLINSDIHVSQGYIDALIHVNHWSHRVKRNRGYFVTSARIDIGQSIEVTERYGQNNEDAILHTFGGLDVFSWTSSSHILINQTVPPFIWGKSRCDNWFLNQVIVDGLVDVVDATELGAIMHYQHSRPYLGNQSDETINEINIWTSVQFSNWYAYVNGVLSFQYGEYKGHLGTGRHTEFKVSPCEEDASICIIRRARPAVCPCEYASYMPKTQTDPVVKHDGTVECGAVSLDSGKDFPLTIRSGNSAHDHQAPVHELEELAEYLGREQVILLLACTSVDQIPELMEAICHLQSLQIHPLVITSDESCWSQLYVLSVAVYLHSIAGVHGDDNTLRREIMFDVTTSLLSMDHQVMWADVTDMWSVKDISWAPLKDSHEDSSAGPHAFLYDCVDGFSLDLNKRCVIYFIPKLGSLETLGKLQQVEETMKKRDAVTACGKDIECGKVFGMTFSTTHVHRISPEQGKRVLSITWGTHDLAIAHYDHARSLCVQ